MIRGPIAAYRRVFVRGLSPLDQLEANVDAIGWNITFIIGVVVMYIAMLIVKLVMT